MKCFKHYTEFATGGCPECKREYAEGHPTPAQPGTLAYLRETVEDCIAILKRDNDAADGAAKGRVSA